MGTSGRFDGHIDAFLRNPDEIYVVPDEDAAPNPRFFQQSLLNRITYRRLRDQISVSRKDDKIYMGKTRKAICDYLGIKPRRDRKKQACLYDDCMARFVKSRNPFAIVRYDHNSPTNVRNNLILAAVRKNLPVTACVKFDTGAVYLIRTDLKEGKHDIQLFS